MFGGEEGKLTLSVANDVEKLSQCLLSQLKVAAQWSIVGTKLSCTFHITFAAGFLACEAKYFFASVMINILGNFIMDSSGLLCRCSG